MITHINRDNFETEVLQSETPVLVDFWAERCAPCRMLAPVLEEIADEMDGKIKFVKIDVDDDENMQIVMEHKIQSIPTLMIFSNGKPEKITVGFRPKEQLVQWISGTE